MANSAASFSSGCWSEKSNGVFASAGEYSSEGTPWSWVELSSRRPAPPRESPLEASLPLRFRDRRNGAHRPAGRELVGGGARLAGSVDSGGHLFRARSDVRVLREAEGGAWLRGR